MTAAPRWVWLLPLAAGIAAGCAKPPLEEIASAEAALKAAREAEAPKLAPQPYQQAEGLMVETYRLNDAKKYDPARGKAIETREKADEAREAALKAKRAAAAGGTGDGGRLAAATTRQTEARIRSEAIGSGTMEEGARLKSLQPVYFDFDDYAIRADQRDRVQAAADWLKGNPTAKLRVEGHTDERGSAEYNLALGSRRANAVRDMLVSLGVEAERIAVQSYGEEAPAVVGHDESAWSKNRRAEFVVSQ